MRILSLLLLLLVVASCTDEVKDETANLSSFQPSTETAAIIPPKIFTDGTIRAMARTEDGSLFIGGDFRHVNPHVVNGLVKTNTDGSVDLSFEARQGFNGDVNMVKFLSDGSIVVAGGFTSYRGFPANRIAKLSVSGELDFDFSPNWGDSDDTNGFSGEVNAIAIDSGDNIYAAGSFFNYRGVSVERIAKISAAGVMDTGFNSGGGNGLNNTAQSIIVSGTDVYVGGYFTTFAGAPANYIAKITTSGTLDTTFNPGGGSNGFGSGPVFSIAITGTDLYVGGFFSAYRTFPANNIAKITTSGVLDTTFNPGAGANGANTAVRAVAISGTDIYIGGAFSSYKGVTANFVAKLDPSGTLNTTFTPVSGSIGTNSAVYSLLIDGTSIYVGGIFTSYRGATAVRVAKLDSSGVLDTTFNPSAADADNTGNGASNLVYTLASDGTDIFIGGSFDYYRGKQVNFLAKIDPVGNLDRNFLPVSGTPGCNGAVYALTYMGGALYVGGTFFACKDLTAFYLTKIDPATGAIDETFSPQSGANGASATVYSLENDGTNIYAGGTFTNYRGSTVNYLAKVNSSGELDGSFNTIGTGFDSSVFSIKVNGTNVYAGGSFANYRSATATRIAKLSSSDGSLDTTFSPASGANGADSTVYAIDTDGTDIFIGGEFDNYRGTAANGIAKLSVDGVLDTTFNPTTGANGVGISTGTGSSLGIRDLIYDGSNVFFTGHYENYRGFSSNYIGKINVAGNLDLEFSPKNDLNGFSHTNGFNIFGHSLLLQNDTLYVGGTFTHYRGVFSPNITTLSTSGESFNDNDIF